jgi:hypothetical protein
VCRKRKWVKINVAAPQCIKAKKNNGWSRICELRMRAFNHRQPSTKASQHPPLTNSGSTQFNLGVNTGLQIQQQAELYNSDWFAAGILIAGMSDTSSVAIQQRWCQLYVRTVRQQNTLCTFINDTPVTRKNDHKRWLRDDMEQEGRGLRQRSTARLLKSAWPWL